MFNCMVGNKTQHKHGQIDENQKKLQYTPEPKIISHLSFATHIFVKLIELKLRYKAEI